MRRSVKINGNLTDRCPLQYDILLTIFCCIRAISKCIIKTTLSQQCYFWTGNDILLTSCQPDSFLNASPTMLLVVNLVLMNNWNNSNPLSHWEANQTIIIFLVHLLCFEVERNQFFSTIFAGEAGGRGSSVKHIIWQLLVRNYN